MLGTQDYLAFNLSRSAPSILLLPTYLVLAILGDLTLVSALIATGAASVVTAAFVCRRVLRRLKLAVPQISVATTSLWYGFRAHAANLSGTINARLDIMIMPAILAAPQVGLYAVATAVSWMIGTLAAAVYPLVLPMAVERGDEGHWTTIRTFRVVVLLGTVVSVPLLLAAGWLLTLVYGAGFEPAASALRLLLPGSVLFAGCQVLWSGLFALNRPATAAMTQLPGIALTVIGLALFLRSGGIEAAAIVSSVSYATVTLMTVVLYLRLTGVDALTFLGMRRRVPDAIDGRQ
jgi:O-antigen/teichoic acid export membrane protein